MTNTKEQPIDPRTRCCANCLYWEVGRCHRFPPLLIYRGERDNTTDDAFVTRFPETHEMCWCGEFQEGDGFSFTHHDVEYEAWIKEENKRLGEAMDKAFSK